MTTIELTGSLVDDLRTLLSLYDPPQAPTQPERKASATAEPIPDSVVDQLQQELAERFPNSVQPTRADITGLFQITPDLQTIRDAITNAEDYARRSEVKRIGALLAASLKKYKDDPATLHQMAEQVRKKAETDQTSIIDTAMKSAARKIARLPSKNEPNAAGVNRLKALGIQKGKESEQRSQGAE